MNLLIKQAIVVDPLSPFNGQNCDIFIENGVISRAGKQLKISADREITIPNLHVSPGWVDIFSSFGDPGYEYKESFETGAAAAAAGGYTDVFVLPNNKPVTQNKAAVEYIVQRNRDLPITIHPIGAITNNAEGKELAEMYDMRNSGAIAFSDGINSVQSGGLLLKALQYVNAFRGVIIQLPDDKSINPHGLMNEGIASTRMGLPGKPDMAEELMVERDLNLAEYTGSSIHLTGITTRRSLDYIAKAKEAGIAVTSSVTPAHLYFSDEDLAGYDSNLKLNPPLRTPAQREALCQAVRNGEIDCLASHHLPHETDSKVLEFEYARYGMIALQTAFAALCTAVKELTPSQLVSLLSVNPRKIFGMNAATIKEGNLASLTLFDPTLEWTLTENDIRSRSANTPFIGKKFRGKAFGIINKGTIALN